MLSIEPSSLPVESHPLSSKNLNQKLEKHANSLLESMRKQGQSTESSWIVFDLKGKILATGATPAWDEKSEFLF